LGNKAPILAAIGIRSSRPFARIKGARDTTSKATSTFLVEKGHLAADQAGFLHLQRFMGNSAAHEIAPPEKEELQAALDIAENLLINLYVLPELAQKMKKSQAQLAARNVKRRKTGD
jgi:hypothetical protein